MIRLLIVDDHAIVREGPDGGQGLANQQIGRRLDVSERTVKSHLTREFQRIGVSDRFEAPLRARQHLPPR